MKAKRRPATGRLDQIIECATTDCYGDDELASGWLCTLEDQIKCPQDCTAGGNPARLVKILEGSDARIHARVKIGGKLLDVPIETAGLKDKRQNDYIEAYKKWLKG